ncbi:MAG: hypothetical protein IPL73_17965 [Candidatus Obscuribacter sp.]|nr:hypothetical protein [Candidatus Obscuribacter sp.]
MSLKFPNARLHVHDLLSNGGLSGPVAIVRSACEDGLISDAERVEVEELVGEEEFCLCLIAAQKVLSSYFEKRRGRPDLPEVNFDEIWNAMVKDAESYKQKVNSAAKCQCEVKSSDCPRFAPALFDMMLQHIRRYP